MAFAGLSDQVRARTKTVTRRRGWTFLRPGDLVLAVERVRNTPGRGREPLAVLRVESVTRERLDAITPDDVAKEGLPDLGVQGFLEMFAAEFGIGPRDEVTRIEFSYHAAPPP